MNENDKIEELEKQLKISNRIQTEQYKLIKQLTEEIQDINNKIKEEIEKKQNKQDTIFFIKLTIFMILLVIIAINWNKIKTFLEYIKFKILF